MTTVTAAATATLTGCLDPALDGPCAVLGEVELWQERSHPLNPGNAMALGPWLWVATRYSARTAVRAARVSR